MDLSRQFHRKARIPCEPLEGRIFLNAGDLDTSFSNDGKATVTLPSGGSLSAVDVAMQTGGRPIVVGESGRNIAVARYTSTGNLDTSFGGAGSGVAFVSYGGDRVSASAVAVQPSDSKIVIVGVDHFGVTGAILVARLTADGLPDPSFSGDGIDVVNGIDGDDLGAFASDVAIQQDGKIVIGGYSQQNIAGINEDMSLVRYNTNGTLDNSFDDNGKRDIDLGSNEFGLGITIDYAGSAANNPDYGKILIVGEQYPNSNIASRKFVITRVNTNGIPDSSFSGDGHVVMPFNSAYTFSSAHDVKVQSVGKIIVIGEVGYADYATHNFGVIRLNANGSTDSTFGVSNGQTEVDFGGADDPLSIVIGQTGRLLVGGGNASGKMLVACLDSTGVPDPFFSGDGKQTISFSGVSASAHGLALYPGGTIVAAGGDHFATARFFDRKAETVSIGTADPTASEAGLDPAYLIVGRSERLPTAQRVLLNVSGSATSPGSSFHQAIDYNGDATIHFGRELTGEPSYVDIAANETFTVVTITPVDDAFIEGDETIAFSIAPAFEYDISPQSNTTLVIRDNDTVAPPSVTSSQFVYDSGPPQVVRFTFSQDVGASLGASDFTITGPSGAVPFALSYDNVVDTATLSLSSVLPDGNYVARAVASGIANSSNQHLAADSLLNFFFLNGDANHDRVVDVSDLGVLASNWQDSDLVFSEGDFSYDGVVDVSDLGILATNWQKSQPLARGSIAGDVQSRISRKAIGAKRLVNDVIDAPQPLFA
jgi:uncharacterized delta-60 repeat protein